MIKIIGLIFFIFLMQYVDKTLQAQCEIPIIPTKIIETDKGPVRGIYLRTENKNMSYAGFKGIPYAKPPINQSRFKPPVEVDPWTGVKNLTLASPNHCPQWNMVTNKYGGDEDCLYLNVYTPNIDCNEEELMPVMVWIYGGAFVEGFIDPALYGPDYILEENVILVAMNYRLGALGFISLDLPDATGNMGLKDQVLALKWVNKNIKNFCGDPKLITIFGQSAGSAAVQLHKLSPMSRGLFTRSIAMSGSPLNIWAVVTTQQAVVRTHILATELGINTDNNTELLKRFHEVTPEKIIRATKRLIVLAVPFSPTIEDPEKATEPFLTECILPAYEAGNFSDEPHILGFVSDEFLSFVDPVAKLMRYLKFALEGILEVTGINSLTELVDLRGDLNATVDDVTSIGYNTIEVAVRITTAVYFIAGIDRTQQLLSKGKGPVYYYRNSFDYPMATHKLRGNLMNGTGHSDDIAHIFHIRDRNDTLDPNFGETIQLQRGRMVKMWTNMAKYGNPTPDPEDPVLDFTWPDSRENGTCLEINEDYEVGERPLPLPIHLTRLIPGGPIRFLAGPCIQTIL